MKFRKKPVEVEAFQVTRGNRWSPDSWPEWARRACRREAIRVATVPSACDLEVVTLEGAMRVNFDDWIIQGVKGELYPCKPDIFAATYEPVSEAGK